MAAAQKDTRSHPRVDNTEAYKGAHLPHCSAIPFNWKHTRLIVVSGDGPNVCGHVLVKAGAYYFHIQNDKSPPYYIGEDGYKRYLEENGKTELQNTKVWLKNPEGAQRKLEELSARNWRYFLFSNNCVHYVEEIFKAGGARFGNPLNCPRLKWELE